MRPTGNRRLFGVNRRALYSFHERDHGPRDGTSLAAYVRALAAEAGVDLTGGRILLLCYPRLLGYAFNPLSVYYGYRADGTLALLIYEVRNTFGETSQLRLPGASGRDQRPGIRQARDKRLLRLALHRNGHALPFPAEHRRART